MEMLEYDCFRSDDDSSQRAPWTRRWIDDFDEAGIKIGKRVRVAHMHKKWLEDTGFLDVREEIYKVLEWLYGEISEC